MVRKTHFLLLVTTIILLPACINKNSIAERAPHWFDHYSAFHKKEYHAFFASRLDSVPDTLDQNAGLINQFYRDNNYEPYWTLRGIQESRIDTLLLHLANADEHGITDTFFGYPAIAQTLERLKNHQTKNDSSIYDTLCNLEMKLTDAYLRYVEALTYGATDPKRANGGKWLMTNLQADTAFICQALQDLKDLPSALKEHQPKSHEYRVLQKELKRLRPLQDSVVTAIPEQVVFKGAQSNALKSVCKRLKLTGELPKSFRDTTVLTDKMLAGINKFRRNNAIPESDSLDIETITKLNRPISYYVDKIAVNMERLRWQVTPAKQDTFIAVNIPDFTLKTIVDGKTVFQTRICCGKTQNPAVDPSRTKNGLVKAFKAESPLLHSEISRLVLNPEWSIPYDILKNEYYYKLCRSNTGIVNRERLYIKDARTGGRVDPESIDWTQVSQNNIPYRLIQTSGRYNALGQIKFDFPNSESVYLHDTNNKGAFKRRVRALSHGCIRVENPFELAAIIYGINEYDSLKIDQLNMLVGMEPISQAGIKFLEEKQKRDSIRRASMTEEELAASVTPKQLKPTGISLKHKMPLYIEYYTCFVGSDDQIQYREDIYYKDSNILYLLKSPQKI